MVFVKMNPEMNFWENIHICNRRHRSEVLGGGIPVNGWAFSVVDRHNASVKTFFFSVSVSVPKALLPPAFFCMKILSSGLAVEIAYHNHHHHYL